MSNILFGSSNVYRNFDRAVASGCFSGRSFTLVKCTRKALFDSHLATITAADLIVTSVLENFITDVCTGVPDDEVRLFAHQQLTAHVESLHGLVSRLPDAANVIICPPMYRSTPAWFGSYLPDFHAFLNSEVARIGSPLIGVMSPFMAVPSLLEPDGIHLSPAGGDRFLAHLGSELTTMLVEATEVPDEAVPMESDAVESDAADDRLSQILNVVNRSATRLDALSTLGESVSSLTKTTAEFEAFARRRFQDDNFIFARLKEESDAEVNRSREDRVVVTGLPVPPSTATTHVAKKEHYTDVITRLVTLACVDVEPLPQVVDVYVNLRKDRGQPLVEVRFDSVSGAQRFRREGVKLAKAEHAEFVSLFFANSVTLSTRVRIEVLKALSKRLTTLTETAYVQGFISRPVIHYRVKEGTRSTAEGTGRSYNFVDAMSKFGSKLSAADLSPAYKIGRAHV